jgi:hypothetical protein
MKKRHSPEQIVRKLHQAEARLAAGATVPEVARELAISEATFHRWRNHYGAMSTTEAPQEAACREGVGHRHPKGGEPGKLLSPTRRRAAVEQVCRHLGVSERRACRVIAQPRSSQRYAGRVRQKGIAGWSNGWSPSRGRISATATDVCGPC